MAQEKHLCQGVEYVEPIGSQTLRLHKPIAGERANPIRVVVGELEEGQSELKYCRHLVGPYWSGWICGMNRGRQPYALNAPCCYRLPKKQAPGVLRLDSSENPDHYMWAKTGEWRPLGGDLVQEYMDARGVTEWQIPPDPEKDGPHALDLVSSMML